MDYVKFTIHQLREYVLDLATRDFSNFVRILAKWGQQKVFKPFYRHVAQQPVTRFVVICRARTGSNFLMWLLDSHPQIWIVSEPFGPDELRKTWVSEQIHQNGLVAYIEEQLQPKPGDIGAGLKILYDQLEPAYAQTWNLPDLPQVTTYLQAGQAFKVMHLKRRNTLKALVSSKIVSINQTYILFNQKKRDDNIQIELTADECEAEFAQVAALEERYDRLFAGHELLELFYEDLTTNTEIESRRILDFLGFDYRRLKPMTVKQNVRPLNQVITNYDELKQYFANTPWSRFF
jgi:LPS sulfotransferase NodH